MPDTIPFGLPAVEYADRTDPGREPDKQVNEDAVGYRETAFGHLCVVCDGMGGHLGGREASTLALKTILDAFDQAVARPDVLPGVRGRELLREALGLANRRVFDLAQAGTFAHPGSTVVAILQHAAGTEIAHVGDSRCAMVHQGQYFPLTKDHSMVQQLVDANVLTPAQAAVHPDANKITRALGMTADVEVEVRPQSVAHIAGDVFVLCSDGLSDMVEQADIVQIAGALPAAQAAGQLVDLANARGGHDNITVAILRACATAIGAREAVKPTVTEAIPQVALPPMSSQSALQSAIASVPIAPSVPSVRSVPSARLYGEDFDVESQRASVPTADAVRNARRVPAVVILGAVLGVVGIAMGGIALWIVLPHEKKTPVAPFAVSALPPSSAAPSVAVAPLAAPEASAAAPVVDATAPAPLPSLVPARAPRPTHPKPAASAGKEIFP